MKFLVVEDEPKNSAYLTQLLKEHYPDAMIMPVAKNNSEFQKSLIHNPDVVFLDIMLEGESVFHALNKIDDFNFKIVFTTAYFEFAINAIEVSAIDYLTKPIQIHDLTKAISRCLDKKLSEFQADILNMRSIFNRNIDLLKIKTNTGFSFIPLDDIYSLESRGKITTIHLFSDTISTSSSLSELTDSLRDNSFCRVHPNAIVNINKVVEYQRGKGGVAILDNNQSISISYRKKKIFLKMLDQISI